MFPSLRVALLGGVCAATALPALAQNFSVDITVDGTTVRRTFSTLTDALDLLEDRGIAAVVPNYTSRSAVTAQLGIRGVAGTITLPAGSTTAIVSFPGAGVERIVTGNTRQQLQTNLRQIFEGSGDTPEETAANRETVTTLLKSAVRTTSLDPIAGHPLSLVGQMNSADQRAALTPLGASMAGPVERPTGWRFAIGASHASTSSGGDNDFFSLPLAASYTFAPNGIEIFADLPVSYAELEGAAYGQGSLGLGLRIPVISRPGLQWSLVPQARAGAAGSEELGAGGYVFGGSLTSDLRVALPGGFGLTLGTGYGYYETGPLEFGDYYVSYDLQNQVLRNTAALGRSFGEVAGRPVSLTVSVTDMRVSGDDFYIPSWQEYGLAVTIGRAAPVTVSASWIDGEKGYDALRVGASFSF